MEGKGGNRADALRPQTLIEVKNGQEKRGILMKIPKSKKSLSD